MFPSSSPTCLLISRVIMASTQPTAYGEPQDIATREVIRAMRTPRRGRSLVVVLLLFLAAPAWAEVCQGGAISRSQLAEYATHATLTPDEQATALATHLPYGQPACPKLLPGRIAPDIRFSPGNRKLEGGYQHQARRAIGVWTSEDVPYCRRRCDLGGLQQQTFHRRKNPLVRGPGGSVETESGPTPPRPGSPPRPRRRHRP
jgi:hypothetical protein